MSPMDGRFYLAAIIVALLGVAAVLVDPLYVIILGILPLIWIGGPLVLLAIVDLLLALRSRRSRRHAFTLLAVVGGFGCFVGIVFPANYYFHMWAVSDAKAYPAKVAPLLEAYRQEHGVYPTRLDQLPSIPQVPRLMRDSGYYSDGQTYSFQIPQPGQFREAWIYHRESQTWFYSE